ncbi:hypothetical protein TNCV_64621 [Trichonephila clavipes]|nr:hypothetical protein TNCV_64621 [Trichonephila clavipes]
MEVRRNVTQKPLSTLICYRVYKADDCNKELYSGCKSNVTSRDNLPANAFAGWHQRLSDRRIRHRDVQERETKNKNAKQQNIYLVQNDPGNSTQAIANHVRFSHLTVLQILYTKDVTSTRNSYCSFNVFFSLFFCYSKG